MSDDEMQSQNSQQQRARYYSSMNYHEYVSAFDKIPQKPEIKPVSVELEDELRTFQLELGCNQNESSSLTQEIKPNESLSYGVQKDISGTSSCSGSGNNGAQLEEMEEEAFESDFDMSPKKAISNNKNRNRSQSENYIGTIFSFLDHRSTRKQSLAS